VRKLISLLVVAALTAALVLSAVAFGATKKVGVRGLAFTPKSLRIKKGTTVRWSWSGAVPHNVTSTRKEKFHSATKPRVTFKHTFRHTGLYTIVCTIHRAAGMTMKIRVT
jgi:plastocyanin